MTLTELHNDPAKMAAFMEWPYEDESIIHDRISELEYEITKLKDQLYSGPQRNPSPFAEEALTAPEATRLRYIDYYMAIYLPQPKQTRGQYVRECAKEALGITGRNVEGVRQKCIAARPDLFCDTDGEFLPERSNQSMPLAPRRLR